MKKNMITVMLSIMMAVLSVGGGYEPALAAETTSEEAVRIEQNEAADPEEADENEDANTGESAEDGSAEEAILAVEGEPVQEGEPAQETEPAQEIGEESDSESDEAVEENESEQDDASETANTSEIAAEDEIEDITDSAVTSVEVDGSAGIDTIEEEIIIEDENKAMAADVWLWPFPTSNTQNQGYSSSHQGVDIGANIGDPIYAVNDGTIYKKYEGCNRYGGYGTPCNSVGVCNPNHGYYSGYCNNGYGNGICLKTKDGYYVQFAHMQSVNSSLYEGQYVTKGTLLGYVGGSGMATGKHCHYAVATGGEFSGFVDPMSMSYVADTEKPVVTDVQIVNKLSTGFGIICKASDNVGIRQIQVAVWNDVIGIDNAKWFTADAPDAVASFQINISDFGNAQNTNYYVNAFAFDTSGNVSEAKTNHGILIENEPPVVTEAGVKDITSNSYWVTCKATDNSKVSKFQFAVWNDVVGIDNAKWFTFDTDKPEYSFYVNTADYGNVQNTTYHVNIFAFDDSGNASTAKTAPSVMLETELPVITELSCKSVSTTGYDLYMKATDNNEVAFFQVATWNDKIGIDNAKWVEVPATDSQANYHVSIEDFNNERNVLYSSSVYAFDKCGNISAGKNIAGIKIETEKTPISEVIIENNRKVYTGKQITQEVVVKAGGKTLTADTDYKVSYENNIDVGTATVTITGIGGYTGTVTKTFLIVPAKTTRGDMFNLANNVKVTWKEVPGAKYYKVYREGITDPSESQKEPVIVTERLIGWDQQPGLTNGHAYRYTIVASLTGKGDPSGDSPLSYSKLMYRLKTVVIRSVKNTAPGKVTVKYDKTATGDSYVLQYCERQDMVGAKTKVVLGANNTSYTIGGLKKGKTYYISIRVRKKVDGIDYYTTFGVPKKITITK